MRAAAEAAAKERDRLEALGNNPKSGDGDDGEDEKMDSETGSKAEGMSRADQEDAMGSGDESMTNVDEEATVRKRKKKGRPPGRGSARKRGKWS
eukprot:CAMPEP_0115036318 /NCGR_PEP_ID=MMETSP0216-20121206/42044_1 /TAXON_ID=223996 /ORGANISM="Protocruzia adherens, Strain Boccale" /LENGTH=93 /DNA_ID=CAMNT_0002416109 /DNA_START=68 /DNA_END=349 /DNA_ORIENTATION=+